MSHIRETIVAQSCESLLTSVRRLSHICATIESHPCDNRLTAVRRLNSQRKIYKLRREIEFPQLEKTLSQLEIILLCPSKAPKGRQLYAASSLDFAACIQSCRPFGAVNVFFEVGIIPHGLLPSCEVLFF